MIRVRTAGEIPARELRSERDGEAYTVSRELTIGSAAGACRILHEVLPAGRRASKPHRHTHRTEFIYAIAGEAVLVDGDREYFLHAGDFAEIPAGGVTAHVLENRGLQPFTYLQIWKEDASNAAIFS